MVPQKITNNRTNKIKRWSEGPTFMFSMKVIPKVFLVLPSYPQTLILYNENFRAI
jgi:hypothetical protein